MNRFCHLFACLVSGFAPTITTSFVAAAERQDTAAVLAPFVNDDTFVAAYIDLTAVPQWDDATHETFLGWLPPASGELFSRIADIREALKFITGLRDQGADAAYFVAALADLNLNGGPLLVCHASEGQQEKLAKRLETIATEVGPTDGFVVRRHGSDLVLAAREATLKRYVSMTKGDRSDLTAPLEQLVKKGTAVAAVICPGPDFRRVVRELWPQLPGSLAPLRGELANQWLHLEAAVHLPPDVKPHIALETTDPEAAASFVHLWRNLPKATTEFGGNPQSRQLAQGYAQLLVDTVPAKADGKRVVLSVPTDAAILQKIFATFGAAGEASMEPRRRGERANQFRNIALGMHMYLSKHQHFPPAAIRDKDGKPLLSWRVALLPFLDQEALYKEFHLDEPWDSPHNRALVARMPAIFADPDPKLAKLAAEGKTTYQVPLGKETAFIDGDGDGHTMNDFKDGTSQTVFVVDVVPEQAVEWTKPADWQVDLEHPRRGLERAGGGYFTAGYVDGHVEIVTLQSRSDGSLRAILTRAAGDRVEGQ